MKKGIIFLMSIILMFTLAIPASASSSELSDDTKYLVPLENVSLKSEEELNSYLKDMGFTEAELSNMSLELKRDIGGNGGAKIKAEKLNPTTIDYDSFGNKTIAPLMRLDTRASFSLYGYAIKNSAPNSSENSYTVYVQYNWPTGPINAYTDTLAMAWQDVATPYGSPYSVHNWRANPQLHQFNNKLQKNQLEGNAWEVDIISDNDREQDGYGKQEIRVSKAEAGRTGAVAIAYSHRYLPGIANAILNFFSISLGGASQSDSYDRFNFTY